MSHLLSLKFIVLFSVRFFTTHAQILAVVQNKKNGMTKKKKKSALRYSSLLKFLETSDLSPHNTFVCEHFQIEIHE